MTPTSIPSAGPHGARNGGGVSSQGPAVNKFGAVAGSSSLSADVAQPSAGGFVLETTQAPGAVTECATSDKNAGGIQ